MSRANGPCAEKLERETPAEFTGRRALFTTGIWGITLPPADLLLYRPWPAPVVGITRCGAPAATLARDPWNSALMAFGGVLYLGRFGLWSAPRTARWYMRRRGLGELRRLVVRIIAGHLLPRTSALRMRGRTSYVYGARVLGGGGGSRYVSRTGALEMATFYIFGFRIWIFSVSRSP